MEAIAFLLMILLFSSFSPPPSSSPLSVIANLHSEALPRLEQRLPHFSAEWEVDVITHDKHRTPCSLLARLHDTDVLLTAHGFQVGERRRGGEQGRRGHSSLLA